MTQDQKLMYVLTMTLITLAALASDSVNSNFVLQVIQWGNA